MKPKRGSKSRKATPQTKVGGRTRSSTRRGHRRTVIPSTNSSALPRISTMKACQEVEVGDLGGFGSAEELEAHEKRCGQEATEFCQTCGRSLCSSHYELLHRDHDTSRGHATQGLAC